MPQKQGEGSSGFRPLQRRDKPAATEDLKTKYAARPDYGLDAGGVLVAGFGVVAGLTGAVPAFSG
jgi:hypothetical protein